MKRIFNKCRLAIVGAGASVALPVLAHADGAFTVTPPSFDMSGLGSYATVILTALAAMWMIRKYVKTTNRS